jgi:hypothetical protein
VWHPVTISFLRSSSNKADSMRMRLPWVRIPPSTKKFYSFFDCKYFNGCSPLYFLPFWCSRVDPAPKWEELYLFSPIWWEAYYGMGTVRHRPHASIVAVISLLRNKNGGEIPIFKEQILKNLVETCCDGEGIPARVSERLPCLRKPSRILDYTKPKQVIK